MFQSRRNFIKAFSLGSIVAPLSALTGCSHQRFYNPDQDILFGAGRYSQNGTIKHVLSAVNIQQNANQQIALDFLAHGIVIDPKNKKRLLVFEKLGAGAAEIDLDSLSVTRKLNNDDGKHYCGHGVFNQSGDTLYCTQISPQNKQCIISIRDGRSLAVVGEFPSFGEAPQHCQLIDDGATMVILNTGGESAKNLAPSITYVDIQSQQLKQRIVLTDQQISSGLVKIANDGSLVVASSPKTNAEIVASGISIGSVQQPMSLLSQPEFVIKQIAGEALSLVIDEQRNIVAATHPNGNMVTFWSLEKRELIKAISVPNPRGITLSLDGKSYIVSYQENSSLVHIGSRDLIADTASIVQPSYITGSYLYNWSKILTEIMPTDVYN